VLHRDWAHLRHIRTGTGLTQPTSAPGLGAPPRAAPRAVAACRCFRCSHHQERARPRRTHDHHGCVADGAHRCRVRGSRACYGSFPQLSACACNGSSFVQAVASLAEAVPSSVLVLPVAAVAAADVAADAAADNSFGYEADRSPAVRWNRPVSHISYVDCFFFAPHHCALGPVSPHPPAVRADGRSVSKSRA
jgi:hypothetical protein